MAGGYIYILGSHAGRLYISVTCNLHLHVMQHKENALKGFTAAYSCKRLLYFEGYEDIRTAIARETTQRMAARKEAQPPLHDQPRVQRFCTNLGMGR
jgi:putative endonuclease